MAKTRRGAPDATPASPATRATADSALDDLHRHHRHRRTEDLLTAHRSDAGSTPRAPRRPPSPGELVRPLSPRRRERPHRPGRAPTQGPSCRSAGSSSLAARAQQFQGRDQPPCCPHPPTLQEPPMMADFCARNSWSVSTPRSCSAAARSNCAGRSCWSRVDPGDRPAGAHQAQAVASLRRPGSQPVPRRRARCRGTRRPSGCAACERRARSAR